LAIGAGISIDNQHAAPRKQACGHVKHADRIFAKWPLRAVAKIAQYSALPGTGIDRIKRASLVAAAAAIRYQHRAGDQAKQGRCGTDRIGIHPGHTLRSVVEITDYSALSRALIDGKQHSALLHASRLIHCQERSWRYRSGHGVARKSACS
jgi:hypothetical protein